MAENEDLETLRKLVEEQKEEIDELKRQIQQTPLKINLKEVEISLPPFSESLDNVAELFSFLMDNQIKVPKGWSLTTRRGRILKTED